MDANALGAILIGAGGVASALVAYLGKRGENAISGYTSLTDQLQEEVKTKKQELANKTTALAQAEAEIARLRGIITRLGGDPQ